MEYTAFVKINPRGTDFSINRSLPAKLFCTHVMCESNEWSVLLVAHLQGMFCKIGRMVESILGVDINTLKTWIYHIKVICFSDPCSILKKNIFGKPYFFIHFLQCFFNCINMDNFFIAFIQAIVQSNDKCLHLIHLVQLQKANRRPEVGKYVKLF